jgi:hypothetical protein
MFLLRRALWRSVIGIGFGIFFDVINFFIIL